MIKFIFELATFEKRLKERQLYIGPQSLFNMEATERFQPAFWNTFVQWEGNRTGSAA